MKRFWLTLALVFLLAAGCNTLNPYNNEFDCKGYPEGVNCTSARELYRLTDYKEKLSPEDRDDKKGKKKPKMLENEIPAPPISNNPGVDPPATAASAVQGMPYDGPLPLRTSAQVMRIWIAPWESQDGVLNMATYMYSEVVERKWAVGEAKMQVAPQITPLQRVEAPDSSPTGSHPARSQQQRQPPRPVQQPPRQQPGITGRPAFPENQKAIPQMQGFTSPFGQNSQQNAFTKSLSELPEGF